jgi:hypothetical protein
VRRAPEQPAGAGVVAAPATTPTRPASPGAPTAPAAAKPAAATPAGAPASTAAPAAVNPSNRAEATFTLLERLSTPEEIEEIGAILRTNTGILDVFGDERSITIGYDPSLMAPDRIRELLSGARHPVAP